MELKFDKEKNFQERIWFYHLYSNWVKSVSNEVWSQQQANFIDSLFQNRHNYGLSPRKYLEMVAAGRKIRKKRM